MVDGGRSVGVAALRLDHGHGGQPGEEHVIGRHVRRGPFGDGEVAPLLRAGAGREGEALAVGLPFDVAELRVDQAAGLALVQVDALADLLSKLDVVLDRFGRFGGGARLGSGQFHFQAHAINVGLLRQPLPLQPLGLSTGDVLLGGQASFGFGLGLSCDALVGRLLFRDRLAQPLQFGLQRRALGVRIGRRHEGAGAKARSPMTVRWS